MGSALLDNSADAIAARDGVDAEDWPRGTPAAHANAAAGMLRREAAERLAAHRNRRRATDAADRAEHVSASPRNARSARIAAAVAERYAQTQSYRDFLAAEAERVVQQARAAAEVAALNARAVSEAQQRLLDALDEGAQPAATAERVAGSSPQCPAAREQPASAGMLWPEPGGCGAFQPQPPRTGRARHRAQHSAGSECQENVAARTETMPLASLDPLAPGIIIRLYRDESGAARLAPGSSTAPTAASVFSAAREFVDRPLTEEEAMLLDEEIAFRHEPAFDGPAGPPTPLPANLIEFPRQLVASRKARPRLAEGPLREEGAEAPGTGQLRIFEVEPEQIATTAEADAAAPPTQWTAMWLDSHPGGVQTAIASSDEARSVAAAEVKARAPESLADVASVGRRMLASAVNAIVMVASFAAFAAIAIWIATHMAPQAPPTAIPLRAQASSFLTRGSLEAGLPFAACAFALLGAMYQALFFFFSTATPGMRAARIALCTFGGENPARSAVRRRLPALLLSAVPMGLGFLWAALDEERLAWHDRICGIYQRSY